MELYPYNPKDQRLKSDVKGLGIGRAFLAHFQVAAALATAANITGIHAPVACSATQTTVVNIAITNPSVPRNITATAGGTAADIKAVQVTITGTNYADEVISETLPAFTIDTAGTVAGNKAFRTVTNVSIPAMDGAGATVSIGFGEKLGLPFKIAHNTVLTAYLDNVKEATAPAVTTSTVDIDENTIDLNSPLNSKLVDAYLLI
ncbi:hypothetical protein REC12_20345 [Desulfosporosinus sp. PR]|uniref:hypothetical protein n=1 Tax=Candidatus Desulfosporosinus nitrosoreducens TaxID=3401928 RepID=UPI0027F8648A|nr:hypothetical protein [Desulfosporosinus sp. PR]MDQ7095948.1 hypothetical protein [Desulfosporosinus sp. PR]